MILKQVISIILGIFVVSSIVYWVVTESTTESSTPDTTSVSNNETQSTVASNSAPTEQSEEEKGVVEKEKIIKGLYFHGSNRCYTCNLMEGYIRDVIRESFGKEVKEGRLSFESINVEDLNNRFYIQEYQLRSISFFLSLHKTGKKIKHENLDKMWRFAGNEPMFKHYIKTEIEKFLEM